MYGIFKVSWLFKIVFVYLSKLKIKVMNKPNRNEFDDKNIYKYVTLFEEYTSELEREIEEWRENYEWEKNDTEELLSEIKDLNTEISQLKDQIVGEDNILDAMTIDWLKQSNNWEIVKQMALKQN